MVATQQSEIKKPEVYDSRRIRLTSPILHIGSEVSKLSPFEYVQTSSKVYLPDKEALARCLQSRGKLQDYINAIDNRREIIGILEQAFGKNWQTATDTNENPIFPEIGISGKWTEDKITDLRPMIRNGFGQLYIPGTSIKGAMRTAIAYHLIKHANKYQTPKTVSHIEQQLRQKLASGELRNNSRQKFADDNLFMNSLFSDFTLKYQEYSPQTKTGPNTDFMRAIHVSDTEPLLRETLTLKNGNKSTVNIPIVTEVLVSSHFENNKAKYRASIYAEMVRNVKTEFTLTIDYEMLSWFRHQQGMIIPFKNSQELLTICQGFAQEQWNGEHDYWNNIEDHKNQEKNLYFDKIRDFYEPEKCPYQSRLGWGSGMTGTTINWLLKDDLRSQLRDTCGIKAPGFEAPKSRRTVTNQDGESSYLPGWVKLQLLKNQQP
ncbi:MAG TPA: type III-A CRISPR-associated RAMP protein Csm5 [Candidatus Obscuribacterales bacterium]